MNPIGDCGEYYSNNFIDCLPNSGLALTSLLPEQNDAIHQRYDVIIQGVCETLNDIMKEDTDDNTIKYVE